jgi:hypothetical protein
MKGVAKGPFHVKLSPEPVHAGAETVLGRRSIAKTYEEDLAATAIGEMLMAGGAVAGSAGYVAIERVDGALGGRMGSFHLQHFGLMARGDGSLKVTVIPDSGTGELTGLTGDLVIRIEPGGAHFYEFSYELPDAP